jgi:hypothetical protein
MVTPRCDDCRFWLGDSNEEGSAGECRRHAPRPLLEKDLDEEPFEDTARQTVWPITFGSEWCGDFGPPPVQQTNELAILQVQVDMLFKENVGLRQSLQEAETTLRDLRRVIVDTEASEGDGQ